MNFYVLLGIGVRVKVKVEDDRGYRVGVKLRV
jgi:hypothetical protein